MSCVRIRCVQSCSRAHQQSEKLTAIAACMSRWYKSLLTVHEAAPIASATSPNEDTLRSAMEFTCQRPPFGAETLARGITTLLTH